MPKNLISNFLIGFIFGSMLTASWHSYHSPIVATICFVCLIIARVNLDLSSPRDPVK